MSCRLQSIQFHLYISIPFLHGIQSWMPGRNCSLIQYVLASTCISNIIREGIIFETTLHCGISSLEDVPIIRSNKCLNYSYCSHIFTGDHYLPLSVAAPELRSRTGCNLTCPLISNCNIFDIGQVMTHSGSITTRSRSILF